jgi:hypothetical protein
MILRPDQIRLRRLTGRPNPYNFGGDSDSDSSTNTTNNTTNHVSSTDMRNVASDSAVAISGSGNAIDRSSSSVTSFIDNSDRSTLTSFVDMSTKDSSTKFTDNSDRSVHTSTTVTDYGSVNGSLTLAGSMTNKAFDTAALGITGAIDVLKKESDNGLKAIGMAFDSVGKQSALAASSSAATLGFANDALKATQSALQDAKDSGQSKMVMTGIIAAGAVAVAFALK